MGATAHIVNIGYEVELLQSGDGQHTTSNLSIRCLSSVKLMPVFAIRIPSGILMLMEIFLLTLATRSVGYLKGCLTGSCTLLSSLTFSASVWISDFRTASNRDGVNFLMRLAVPFVESREIDSVLCAEFLYRDILWKVLGLVQKPKALKIFTAVYHSSHSLDECKGIIFPHHIQDVKIDSLLLTLSFYNLRTPDNPLYNQRHRTPRSPIPYKLLLKRNPPNLSKVQV